MRKSLILAIVVITSSAFAADKQYFAVFMDGKKIGYSVHSRIAGNGQVTTTQTIDLTVARSGLEMHVAQSETCYESTAGKPLGFKSVMEMSGMKQTVTGKILNEEMAVTTDVAGSKQTVKQPWPTGAVMAEGLRLIQLQKGLTPGSSYSAKAFSPGTMTAIDANVTIIGPEKIDLLGRVVTLTKAQTSFNIGGGTMVETAYLDSDLVSQKSITPAMGFQIELVACNKAFALSKNDVVDFIDKSLVPCPVSLGAGANAKSIQYSITSISGSKLSFPNTYAQSVASSADGITLTVSSLPIPSAVKFPYVGNDPNALAALKPSMYVQSDNKTIKQLAAQAVAGATDAATAAANIAKFVRSYISEKNYSVGYASALEVAQSRQGDCTEHAVLMTALCQAAGIPSRVAFGLLYVDKFDSRTNVFVGHAWTQCLIGDKWIDFDATRHAVGPTRITMATGNGDPEQFFSMLATFGNFKIRNALVK